MADRGQVLKQLGETPSANMMAFIDDAQPGVPKDGPKVRLLQDGLQHAQDNVFVLHVPRLLLHQPDACPGQKRRNAVAPLVEEKLFMHNDEGFGLPLGNQATSHDGFPGAAAGFQHCVPAGPKTKFPQHSLHGSVLVGT